MNHYMVVMVAIVHAAKTGISYLLIIIAAMKPDSTQTSGLKGVWSLEEPLLTRTKSGIG